MRICSRCKTPDRKRIRDADCTCKAGQFAPDDEHDWFLPCAMAGHEVRMWVYPQILRAKDLVLAPDTPHGYKLPAALRGSWELVQRRAMRNGQLTPVANQWARQRLLCSACIVAETQTAERVMEYETVRAKLAKGKEAVTFSRAMTMQDAL